jgi:hypothetical protein
MSVLSVTRRKRRGTWLLAVCAVAAVLAVPGTAAAMLSRFGDQPMPIGANGRSLTTDGPVDWDPGETRAIFFIVVRQGAVIATGIRQQQPPSETWQVRTRVRGHGSLVPGPADGFGTAVVLNADGSLETRVWSGPITLR